MLLRSATIVSTSRRRVHVGGVPALILSIGAVALGAGCINPKGQLDDFNNRVPDAKSLDHPDGMPLNTLPDVNGVFLMEYAVPQSPDMPIKSLATLTMVKHPDGTATVTHSAVWLTLTTSDMTADTVNLHVGAGSPQTFEVNKAGEFTGDLGTYIIPADSNFLHTDSTVMDTVVGTIHSTDCIDGTAAGRVLMPVNVSVNGTKWAAIRVMPGQIGATLPPGRVTCDTTMIPDAGVPDAPVPDAAKPDATLPDAM